MDFFFKLLAMYAYIFLDLFCNFLDDNMIKQTAKIHYMK